MAREPHQFGHEYFQQVESKEIDADKGGYGCSQKLDAPGQSIQSPVDEEGIIACALKAIWK